jgi:hypothetical protein
MIKKVFKDLDAWAVKTNKEAVNNSWPAITPFYIKVLGQTALIETQIDLNLTATMDVDVYADYHFAVKNEFENLLKKYGRSLDPDSDKIWMPTETEYKEVFKGSLLTGSIAKSEYVLISKALKAPGKNKSLIMEYLAKGPSELFMELALKYEVDLKGFTK